VMEDVTPYRSPEMGDLSSVLIEAEVRHTFGAKLSRIRWRTHDRHP